MIKRCSGRYAGYGTMIPYTSTIQAGLSYVPYTQYITATGGTVSLYEDYIIHTFTSSGTFTISSGSESVEFLVVGGGGGASQGSGGGGGFVEGEKELVPGTYTITVGAGGAGDYANSGVNTTNGGNSSIVGGPVNIVALGGGGGGGSNSNGKDGGSGGGGGGNSMGTTYGGNALQPSSSSGGYGYPGIGNQASNSSPYYCGVGGGAGGSPTTRGGAGGVGRASSITGTPTTYAAGGAGNNYYGGTGASGTANTGNGGGASGGGSNYLGGSGGSGIVVVRYKQQPKTGTGPLNLTTAVPWACYGIRALKSTYYGNIIRLRRSSDNTEKDFGSTISCDLDTASILSWVGSGDAYVRTWYDQSGNGRHMVQATNGSQPQFVKSGALYLSNNRPYIKFNGVENGAATPLTITANSPIAVHAVQYRPGNGVSDWVLGHTSVYNYHGTSTNKLWDSYGAGSVINGTTRCMGQLFSPAINCNNAPIQSPCVIHHTNTSGAEWNNLGQDRSYHQSTGGYFELIVWATQSYTTNEALEMHNNQLSYYVV